jgi:hypothetical protein
VTAAAVRLQARILAHLHAYPGLTAYEVARALHMIDGWGRPQTRTAEVALLALEAAGHVRRARDSAGRRTWHPIS